MAIDPTISLAVRPVQMPLPNIQSPVDRLAQVLSLRNLMTQGQSGQLDLQTKQMQLEQMQMDRDNQRKLLEYLTQHQGTAGAAPVTAPQTAGVPPVQTPPLQTPPVQPTPIGGTVAQIAPAVQAPPIQMPGAPLNALMTPQTPTDQSQGWQAPTATNAAPAATPAAPAGTSPAIAGQSGFPAVNIGDIVTRFGNAGMAYATKYNEAHKAELENQIKQADLIAKNATRLAGIGIGIRDSKDPASQFASGVMQAVSENLVPAAVGRQMLADGYEKHKNDVQGFIDQAQNAKDQAELHNSDMKALLEERKNVGLAMRGVGSQQDYATKVVPMLSPELHAELGDTWSPQLKQHVSTWDTSSENLPKAAMGQIQLDATKLAAARAQGDDAFNTALASVSKDSQDIFTGAKTPLEVMQRAQDPEKFVTSAQAAATASETARHNLSTESNARLTAAIAVGKLEQTKLINGMKYGPGTQEYWVQQLKDNPDSIKEMPPEFRSSVGQLFRQATGLPLPTPLSAATQTQETAARNALDGITFINKALQNPEIRANIGPIMGRLGNVEQAAGAAVGLSPQAEQLAQELRTRMRYFVFQEGKAVLGGRLPQKLMESLEASSANVKMEPDMLQGALNGAEGNAQSVLDNADRQRFGGKMRPREMRGAAPAAQTVTPDVQKALSGAERGKMHKLSDGSWWIVNTDGSIAPAPAPSR